jgi:hypothetical protein
MFMQSKSQTDAQTARRCAMSALVAAALLSACGGGGGDDAPGPTPTPQEPPPWGSLTLTGTGAVGQALSKFTPNRVPFAGQDDSSTNHSLLWTYNNLYDPRATVAEPSTVNSGDLLITTDIVSPSGAFIGQLTAGFFLNAPDASSPTHSAVLNCGGGSGLYAAFARDAGCDRITWNATTRTVRFDNVTLPNIATALNGELSYPSFEVSATTTGRASSWGACPAATNDVAPLRWSDAQCLNGTYVGVSDNNKPCMLTVDSATETARVEIDGYTQTYRFGLGYEGIARTVNGVLQRTWEFYFGTTAMLPTAQAADALLVSMGDRPELRWGNTALGNSLGFVVQHTSAPAGVAGPVDTKFCLGAVAR